MIALSIPEKRHWNMISFSSTLYLHPILDVLLESVPAMWQQEIRLGLQEALVNAAKHGNNLDPTKTVEVRFSCNRDVYIWEICDQGKGFAYECCCKGQEDLPSEDAENGRGLCILNQIFDEIQWSKQGTQLTLYKYMNLTRIKR